jgi:glycine/D-amino acid oxidase-like deaminating enzyme
VTALARGPDVAVIGGGVLGTALAWFLAEAGASVRLYERSAIAAGASGRNSGIVQHPFDPVLAALYRSSVEEYRALSARTDFRFPRAPSGLLYVGRDGPLAARIAAEWGDAWPDARAEVVSGASLPTVEPALAPDLIACRLDVGYPVGPAAATEAFARLARDGGVDVTVGGEARPAVSEDRVVGVELQGAIEPAGAVVVTAGPWSPTLVDPSGAWRPIRPVWGVVASVVVPGAPRHGLEAIDIDIEPGASGDRAGEPFVPVDELVDFSLVPGERSSALGSTFLPTEPEPERWVDALRRVGSRYVPAIAHAPVVGVRHCARPVSLDGRPLVGAVAGLDGLFIAAGHGPWGISTGPGTARMLAGRILGGTGEDAIPAALRPERFGSPLNASSSS